MSWQLCCCIDIVWGTGVMKLRVLGYCDNKRTFKGLALLRACSASAKHRRREPHATWLSHRSDSRATAPAFMCMYTPGFRKFVEYRYTRQVRLCADAHIQHRYAWLLGRGPKVCVPVVDRFCCTLQALSLQTLREKCKDLTRQLALATSTSNTRGSFTRHAAQPSASKPAPARPASASRSSTARRSVSPVVKPRAPGV